MSDPAAPKHILLIEDEQSVLTALTLLLEALGYRVTGFNSPTQAVSAIQAQKDFDLCICDLRMPEKNGLEVLTEVKVAQPELPFVLMSAHAREVEVEKAKSLGADGFLSKPFYPDDLTALVGSLGI